ncbi:hypothetical protein GC425_09625 [Corynebacterium sp. zg254]|uniref:Uncharacterized protein n=1 Tax=Corynebacterium zhongnanshanii TaxID=2768834 RepID=A0ABQ6VBX6_9CORY|nr:MULTISPECIES: hypothetical protein [Corynebacterium]KAB3519246.1 hypothetical protein F8377_09680 [Corynebacterium zhongnanshanii]MCR5915097.1 hypothetical protein [Corynebacterium sp. zg254]
MRNNTLDSDTSLVPTWNFSNEVEIPFSDLLPYDMLNDTFVLALKDQYRFCVIMLLEVDIRDNSNVCRGATWQEVARRFKLKLDPTKPFGEAFVAERESTLYSQFERKVIPPDYVDLDVPWQFLRPIMGLPDGGYIIDEGEIPKGVNKRIFNGWAVATAFCTGERMDVEKTRSTLTTACWKASEWLYFVPIDGTRVIICTNLQEQVDEILNEPEIESALLWSPPGTG